MKNIIFDFGGVILNLDVSATLKAFNELGIKEITNPSGHYYRDPVFNKYEIGQVSDQEFRDVVKTLSNQSISDDEINGAWTKMLLDIPKDRVNFILELKEKYRIFLLSNTNHIHQLHFEPYFEKKFGFPFQDLFEKIYYSHDAGIRKPDREAFTNVLDKSGLVASESLFVDDSMDNINTAGGLGFKTHHIVPGYQLQDVLKSL